ncbi:MAG: YIP1 family protein [Nitrospiraceae bacterium]|nr:YIP1 family protein [Nitrospiraceae bacterium]
MESGKNIIENLLSTAVKVITNPWGFYREMPKTGGFQDPIIFFIVMVVIAMVIGFIGALLHIGGAPIGVMAGTAGALIGIIIGPIVGLVFSFVAAAILFVIWKIMGSQENYEVAYRCAAYSSGIVPITTILGFIPYIGSLLALIWGFYLLIVASIETHKIKSNVAWLVWGIIAAIFIIVSLSAQIAARKFASDWPTKAKEMEKASKEMEEAVKKMQEELAKQKEK